MAAEPSGRPRGRLAGAVPRLSHFAAEYLLLLPIGAAIVRLTAGVEARFPTSLALLAVAGLIVGFGTRLGSGCTSGHGVIGMARLSPRSLAATATFMAFGIATTTLLHFSGIAS